MVDISYRFHADRSIARAYSAYDHHEAYLFRYALAGASAGESLFLGIFFRIDHFRVTAFPPAFSMEGRRSFGKSLVAAGFLGYPWDFLFLAGSGRLLDFGTGNVFPPGWGVCVLENRFRPGTVDRRIHLRDGACPLASHLDGPEWLARVSWIIPVRDGRRSIRLPFLLFLGYNETNDSFRIPKDEWFTV